MEALLNRIAREQRKQEWIEFDPALFLEMVGSFKMMDGRGVIDFCIVEEFCSKLKEMVEEKTNTRIRVYDDGTAIFCDRKRIENLTSVERRLIGVLSRQNSSLSIESINESVWSNPNIARGTVYNSISKLNGKLEKAGLPFRIQTESGVGYRIEFWKPVAAPAD